MKSGFWKTDWFFGLVVALVMLLVVSTAMLQGLERKAFDLGVRSSDRVPLERIAVIAIDDASMAALGQWPWSREIHARMTDILGAAKAKVVATTVPFFAPQIDPGYKYITRLLQLAGASGPAPSAPAGGATETAPAAAAPPSAGELGQFVALLREAQSALSADQTVADSIARAKNVVLPMSFAVGEPAAKAGRPLPAYVTGSALADRQLAELRPLRTAAVHAPIEAIGKAAAGVGHLSPIPEADGAVRAESLVLEHQNRFYPSLSLMIAARSLGLGPADIKVRPGEGLSLGSLRINTDPSVRMYTHFYQDRDGKPAFQADSFYDVYTGKIDAAKKYAGKIVLIGATAGVAGGLLLPTPVGTAMAPVFTVAHTVSSILQEHSYAAPAWGWMAEKGVFALIAAYLVLMLPRLAAGPAAAVTAGIAIALLAVQFVLMSTQGLSIQLMAPLALLIVGYVALVAKRVLTRRAPVVQTPESALEAGRMLGLAYQGQGQLDMAWEKFRLLPLSDPLMDNLYPLGVEFEKKGQSTKAEAVFRHMSAYNPKFRDLEIRLSPAKQMSETVILGSGAGAAGKSASPVPEGASAAKPMMLGRYEVEKELGKGAMGVVYQGRDPKIGRVVAIKTMALAQEFEVDELAEVKERFFREAETAGRLAHQNIVTIYDAGEAGSLAFIAMELLKGGDLGPYTKPGALLPMPKVISIIARTADALGYAHKQGVVHRDIKPANIMYHLESDTVKVTDFGIARLTDSSKTKTGMVLGTPSYMSPEQLAGTKIDGRSDLFSLAGTLYQMLCGKLPFDGSSMGRLMFNISSEPPADILSINPNVPHNIVNFLNRAMEKEPGKRYQTGEEFAAALREAADAGRPTVSASSESATSVVDIQL